MKKTREELKEKILWNLQMNTILERNAIDIEDLYFAVVEVLKENIFDLWVKSNVEKRGKREIAFLSFEYLPEEFLQRNVVYLDVIEDVRSIVEELGFSLEQLKKIDIVNKLGDGGLGDASFAFLDTAATKKDSVVAYGIRYEGGHLRQSIENFEQLEYSDDWLKNGNPWELERKRIYYDIPIGDYTVQAAAYDIPVLGFQNGYVNTLRLWQARSIEPVDYNAFSEGKIQESYKNRIRARAITEFLYPSDSSDQGRELRLTQEYFFAAASIKDILNRQRHHSHMDNIEEYCRIKLNEVHSIMAIPVFIYEYMKSEEKPFDAALAKANQIFDFTTYKVRNEISEWWDVHLIQKICPWIYPIIEKLNDEICALVETPLFNFTPEEFDRTKIIEEDKVKMIPLAIFGSGITSLAVKDQLEIMLGDNLDCIATLFHSRFRFRELGVNHRIWLMESNPLLFDFLTKELNIDLINQPDALTSILERSDSEEIAYRLDDIKKKNKEKFTKIFLKDRGDVINPYSIFDINNDDFLETKRQLIEALYIAYEFINMKEQPNLDFPDRTFFFAGKANRNYLMAKLVIKFINCLSYCVSKEVKIKEKLKIVFIDNRNMNNMMKLIPTADIGEQLSLPGKEVAMTNGLRFMLNGAVLIGSQTSINHRIRNIVGEENIKLFGANFEDVKNQSRYSYYNYYEFIKNHEKMNHFITQLSNINNQELRECFRLILNLIGRYNDGFFIFRDLEEYIEAQRTLGELYYDSCIWRKMSLNNIGKSGVFNLDSSYDINEKHIWDSRR